MCTTCGCEGATHHHDHDPHSHHHEHAHHHEHEAPEVSRRVQLERELVARNRALADVNRRWLEERGVLMLNVIGGPGSGKTALLEETVRRLAPDVDVAVIEGDQATDIDATRIRRCGCRAIQITTGPGCHLDANIVGNGVRALAPKPGAVIFVENVGNLVCPALFDVGERAKVVVMSVTEGEDKPLKYPHAFREAGLLVLSKLDLAPHVDFSPARCLENARQVHPHLGVVGVSARSGEGLATWCGWVRTEVKRMRARAASAAPAMVPA
jgi:hydrogenase nickel incorporation protein HypB